MAGELGDLLKKDYEVPSGRYVSKELWDEIQLFIADAFNQAYCVCEEAEIEPGTCFACWAEKLSEKL